MTFRTFMHSFLTASLFALAACGGSASSDGAETEGQLVAPKHETPFAQLTAVEAGVDYPTDAPLPASLARKKILVLGDARIVVADTAKIVEPEAGVDYPTDTDIPDSLRGKKVLTISEYQRIVLDFDTPKAGVDFPTDSPPVEGVIWVFSETFRLNVEQIKSIEVAVAGVDYPTDTLEQSFLVVVSRSGERFRLRST